jgi:hypothetical protein
MFVELLFHADTDTSVIQHLNKWSDKIACCLLPKKQTKNKLPGLSPRANYTDRATAGLLPIQVKFNLRIYHTKCNMLLKKPTQIQELHQVFAMVQEYEF